jgi:hypothetical protein
MHSIFMFDRTDTIKTEGFEGSDTDWLDMLYQPYMKGDNNVGASSYCMSCPQQEGKRTSYRKPRTSSFCCGFERAEISTKLILLRELLTQHGFHIAFVKDATATNYPNRQVRRVPSSPTS